MTARVYFNIPQYWQVFYSSYGVVIKREPNDRGWVNLPCVLETHPGFDDAEHGGVDLRTGRYKCFSDTCRSRYQEQFGVERDLLYAHEFLQIQQPGMPESQALEIVESFRQAEIIEPEKAHYDDFSKTFAPDASWTEFAKRAQSSLKPNLEIVQQYCRSRSLKFETLQQAGMGYVPPGPDQQECLIHIYYLNGRVVGLRGRTIDGRKGGVKNAYATLYQLQTLESTRSKTAIICEGETDVLATRQLLNDNDLSNIPVLGTPGNEFKKEWGRHLQYFNRILALSQTDAASDRFTRGIVRAFPNAEVVQLPFPPQSHGKDVSDFLRLGRESATTLLELLGLSEDDYEAPPYVLTGTDLVRLASQEIPWLVENLIERGTKVIMTGPPKSYKTWLVLQMADSLANGTPCLGRDEWQIPVQGKVLLIEEEGSPNRLGKRWAGLSSNPYTENFRVIHRQNTRLDQETSLQLLRREIARFKPDLIIFDPYASIHGQDENTVQGTMLIMNVVDSFIRMRPTASVLIVHHTGKGGPGPRGSSSLWGAMDLQIEIFRPEITKPEIVVWPRGRDLSDDQSMGIGFEFDRENMRLRCTELRVRDISKGVIGREKVCEVMSQYAEDWQQLPEIAQKANVAPDTTRWHLGELVKEGRIEVRRTLSPGRPYEYKLIPHPALDTSLDE